ncbi:MAG: MlaD family protein [Rikenellaceae bacterium]
MKIKREIKVAVYTLLVLFAAYWGVNFLKGLDIFSQTHTLKAKFPESDNIEVSSAVLIKGVKVGSVTAINLGSIDSDIEVSFTVNKKYKIPENSEAIIANQSMLGGKVIMIKTGNATTYLEDDDYINGRLDDNMTKQIDEVKDQVYGALTALKTTLDNINSILDEETIKNITSTVSNVNEMSEDAAKSIKSMSGELIAIASNLENITSDFKETTPFLRNTVENFSIMSDSLSASLPSLVSSVNSTLAEVETTISNINDKKGTMGMMFNDTSLYDNLESSTANLSSLLMDLQENPSRYVHISVFGRKDPLTRANIKKMKKELKEEAKNNK